MLHSTGFKRIIHDGATELNCPDISIFSLITDTQIRTQTNMHLDLHPQKTKFRDLGYMYHNLGDKRSAPMYTNICARGELHLILRNRHLKIKNKCDYLENWALPFDIREGNFQVQTHFKLSSSLLA